LQNADQELVLTLADEEILKKPEGRSNYELNEDQDKLENIQLIEKSKAQEFQDRKKKKPAYNAYDDTQKNILSQYDDPVAKPTFKIGESGKTDEQEEIKRRLEESGKRIESLEFKTGIASEYYSQQEMEKFKKRSGKKKERKLKSRETETTTEDQNNNNNENNKSNEGNVNMSDKTNELKTENPKIKEPEQILNHLASSDFGNRERRNEMKQKQEQQKREKLDKNYEKAVERANTESRLLFEEEDKILARELSNNKNMKKQNILSIPEEIAQQLKLKKAKFENGNQNRRSIWSWK